MKNTNMMAKAITKVIELNEIEFDFNTEFWLHQIPDHLYGDGFWRFHIRNKNGGGSRDYLLQWDEGKETFLSASQF